MHIQEIGADHESTNRKQCSYLTSGEQYTEYEGAMPETWVFIVEIRIILNKNQHSLPSVPKNKTPEKTFPKQKQWNWNESHDVT